MVLNSFLMLFWTQNIFETPWGHFNPQKCWNFYDFMKVVGFGWKIAVWVIWWCWIQFLFFILFLFIFIIIFTALKFGRRRETSAFHACFFFGRHESTLTKKHPALQKCQQQNKQYPEYFFGGAATVSSAPPHYIYIRLYT